MDFKQLRAFLTVADMGNVTRAAEVLHLVQPAVSRQIRLLEEDVGSPLFERGRHGMVLTEAGQALMGYARRAMLELERARAEIGGTRAPAGGIGGLVTLGMLPSTIDTLSGPLVGALAREYPGIRIRIAMGYAGTLQRWLQTGEVDAALLYGAERSTDFDVRPLIEEPLWVIGPPGTKGLHGLAGTKGLHGLGGTKGLQGLAGAKPRRGKPLALSSLVAQPFVLPSAPHGIRTLVDHACAVAGVELRIAAETNALSVQRSLVLAGHGLTILPPIAVVDDLKSGHLCGAPLGDPPITRTIVLAMPTQRPAPAHVRCATEALVACARRAVHEGHWPEGVWLAG